MSKPYIKENITSLGFTSKRNIPCLTYENINVVYFFLTIHMGSKEVAVEILKSEITFMNIEVLDESLYVQIGEFWNNILSAS